MTFLTRLSLVLLRIAIGWHFLFEGIEKLDSYFRWSSPPDSKVVLPFEVVLKLDSYRLPPAEAKPVWTSEFYLRESTGPFRGIFRTVAGDLNEAALDRLVIPPGQPPRLPPALDKDWKETFDAFVAHYGVGDEQAGKMVPPEFVRIVAVSPQGFFPANLPWTAIATAKRLEQPDKLQLVLAETALDQAKAEALLWLVHGERDATRSFSRVTEKVKETTPERIKAYRAKLAELHDIEKYGQPAFDKDVWKKKLSALKDDIKKMRTELLAEVNRPMKEALDFTFKYRLTPDQRAKGPLPQAKPMGMLFWIDQITMWGVTAVGVCLLLGLFTRTACVVGAGFLLMFYLAMPALPWLPANPRAEGHYLFINKNLVEMLALLALATTCSGRWAGLDGLIHALNPWHRDVGDKAHGPRPVGVESPAPALRAVSAAPSPSPVTSSPVKESPHGP